MKKYVSITYHFVLQIHLRNFEQGIWFHPEYSSVRESYTAIISQQYNQNRKYFSTDWVLYIMSNNQLSKFIVLLKIKYLKHIFLLEINIVLILLFEIIWGKLLHLFITIGVNQLILVRTLKFFPCLWIQD